MNAQPATEPSRTAVGVTVFAAVMLIMIGAFQAIQGLVALVNDTFYVAGEEYIFTLDLSGADVITVFLYPRLMERLIPQFEKLKPGSRILSHQFDMPGVKPDKLLIVESKEDGDKHRIFLWTAPLKKELSSH